MENDILRRDTEKDNKVDVENIISELRTKKKSQILEEVLERVENDDDVKSLRPKLDDDTHTETYNISKDELGMYYDLPIGSRDKYSIVFLRIINLINSGLSPNIGIFGKSQRGKSETALHILHTLHNDLNVLRGEFSPKNQVLYSVVPFLLFYRHNRRVGALFEEAGETINKNDYNSKMNRAVRGTLRTQGKKQIPNIFVTPNYDALDPDVRDEIDIEIEMESTGKAKITFYERIHSRKAENQNRKYEFARIDGKWDVPRPPKKIRREYDEIDSGYKGRYLDDLLKDVIEEQIEMEKENRLMEF